MKVLANKLNLTEATEMVRGAEINGEELAMYRMAWIEDGFHPAQVALGFDADGELYDIAEDENYAICQQDVLANDWVVISITDGETVEDKRGGNEEFDEAVVEMLQAFRKMNRTRTNHPRHEFFNALAHDLTVYFGAKTMQTFMETGELVHGDECECPACEQSRFEDDPKQFVEDKIETLIKDLTKSLEEEAKAQENKEGKEADAMEEFLKALFS